MKGEPLTPPAGRADDFAWPRREVGREQAKGDTPVASVSPDGVLGAVLPQGQKQKRPATNQPGAPVPLQSTPPSIRNFFGFGASPQPPRQTQPAPRTPGPNAPRPPASVGRSASAPQGNIAQ